MQTLTLKDVRQRSLTVLILSVKQKERLSLYVSSCLQLQTFFKWNVKWTCKNVKYWFQTAQRHCQDLHQWAPSDIQYIMQQLQLDTNTLHVTAWDHRANRKPCVPCTHIPSLTMQASHAGILLNSCGSYSSRVRDARPPHIFLSGRSLHQVLTLWNSGCNRNN